MSSGSAVFLSPFIGHVRCISAQRLLDALGEESVALVILDPPGGLGIGLSDEDDTTVDEMTAALVPIAERVTKLLVPGGAVVILGGPLLLSAWELAASWAGLRLSAELFVLWDTNRRPEYLTSSLATSVRWHLKPGMRATRSKQVDVRSNVVICQEVPYEERVNPAQRPVELFNYLVTLLTEPGDLVVDPYCGSGSALVAAEMTGRRWAGGDINPSQCVSAAARVSHVELEEAYLQPMHLWVGGRLIIVEGG